MQWRASSVFAAVDFPAPELPTSSALWLLRVQTERYAVAPVRRLVPTIGWPASLKGVPSTGSRRAATASVVSWRLRRSGAIPGAAASAGSSPGTVARTTVKPRPVSRAPTRSALSSHSVRVLARSARVSASCKPVALPAASSAWRRSASARATSASTSPRPSRSEVRSDDRCRRRERRTTS